MTVWAEGVFLLNASLDYLLLAGAVRLRGGRPGKRLIGAALLGGAASVLALFPPFRGFGVSAAGFFLLVLCAYGLSLDGLRCGAVFLALSLALCGIQTALAPMTGGLIRTAEGIFLRVTWPMLAASAALLYGFAASVSGAVTGKKPRLIPVQITAAAQGYSLCPSDTPQICPSSSFSSRMRHFSNRTPSRRHSETIASTISTARSETGNTRRPRSTFSGTPSPSKSSIVSLGERRFNAV